MSRRSADVGFSDPSVFESLLFLQLLITHPSVSHPSKAHWVAELDFGGILNLSCFLLPIGDEYVFVHASPGTT